MVVTIVGILSAVALPAFLSQADKAKATEAKTMIATTLKQAQAKWMEDSDDPEDAIADMNTEYGTPLDDTTNFNYTQASWEDNIWQITATAGANSNVDEGKAISGCANFETGKVAIGNALAANLTAAEADTDVDCE